jgi:hypothetical protein
MSTKPSSDEPSDLQEAFARLSDAQIAALDGQGRHRLVRPDDVLFAEGDRDGGFFVMLVRVGSAKRARARW